MSVAENVRSAAPHIPTGEELVARARKLAPKLRERAVACERERNIPRESVEEYIDAGLVRTIMPKRWGGYEHDHEVAFNIAIELGKSTCGSSAWSLNYLSDHAGILSHFPEEAQHDVWSRSQDACIATSAAPTGKAAVAPGGYRLDGKWSWCSGLRHSQWIMIGGLVFREGEHHPDMRLFLVPVVRGQAARHLVLRRPARQRVEHRPGSTTCSSPSTAACRSRPCATPARRARRSTPIRSTARRSSRCTTYALLGPALGLGARRLRGLRAMDAPALSHLHPARHRPARAGADRGGRNLGADRRRRSCWHAAAWRPRGRTTPA